MLPAAQLNPLEMPGEAVHLERQAFNRRKTKANKQLTGADLHFMQARLANMLDDNGRIMPRRRTGLSYAQQRRASRAVKAARDMALLPHDESAQKIRRFEQGSFSWFQREVGRWLKIVRMDSSRRSKGAREKAGRIQGDYGT